MSFFPHDKDRDGAFLGRIWSPQDAGPSVVAIRDGMVVDITTVAAPLVSDICEMENPAAYVRSMEGRPVGTLEEIAAHPSGDLARPHFLAPCDLQAVKACGVTFASLDGRAGDRGEGGRRSGQGAGDPRPRRRRHRRQPAQSSRPARRRRHRSRRR